jgi:hypothetical protein
MKTKLEAFLIKKKINYPINESENHPAHDMMIFYGWMGK